jgi:hypothetical protein
MDVTHHGDPTGSFTRSDLGGDPARVPERAAAELRHRDVTRPLIEQYQRAAANGDPTGSEPHKRVQQEADHQVDPSHLFRHYE